MKLRENTLVKVLAFLLATVLLAAGVIMGLFQIFHAEILWGGGDVGSSYLVRRRQQEDYYDLTHLVWLHEQVRAGEELDYYQQQSLAELEERFDPQNTNLRWYAQLADGTVVDGNTDETAPNPAPAYWLIDGWSGIDAMDYHLWLDRVLPVEDSYKQAVTMLREWNANRGAALAATVACLLLSVGLTVLLCVTCGHKRGYTGIWLNWFHRIPGDLMAVVYFALVPLLCMAAEGLDWVIPLDGAPVWLPLALGGLWAWAAALLVISGLITFTARCKGRTLLRNTVIWRLCRWFWRGCVWVGRGCLTILSALPLIWKVLAAGVLFGLGMLLFHRYAFLLFLLWLVVMAFLCLWACQWGKIRKGTREIIGGRPDYNIDTRWMLPDLKEHAEQLNNLGQAISAAVDDRMKSERFRAELITNVSHDLKTPLTSIINYVDLLKKQPIEDPTVQEYIEVLDRKSQRLKKLTEDLVEASKASTGNLGIRLERIGLNQLADQALAEYEQRFGEKNLRVVRSFPGEELWVEADGRHLWRVLDNLFSNCAKYSLEGTRVYVEICPRGDRAALSVQNISREELNVAPELLVERFVRGDESRTTEGSGLGLSIAQSLTELQQGSFEVDIDGDLFKATLTLPLAKE